MHQKKRENELNFHFPMKRQSLSTTDVEAMIFPSEIRVQLLCSLIKLASVAADPQQSKFACFFMVCFAILGSVACFSHFSLICIHH